MTSLQAHLEEKMPELYVYKDRGQLNSEELSVGFPCCLLDVKSVNYSHAAQGSKLGNIQITLSVADSYWVSPETEETYDIFDLLEKIDDALEQYTDGTFSPLYCLDIMSNSADTFYESYIMTYETAYQKNYQKPETKEMIPPPVKINIEEQ